MFPTVGSRSALKHTTLEEWNRGATHSVCWNHKVHAFCSLHALLPRLQFISLDRDMLSLPRTRTLGSTILHQRKPRNLMRITMLLWPLQIIHLVAKPNALSVRAACCFPTILLCRWSLIRSLQNQSRNPFKWLHAPEEIWLSCLSTTSKSRVSCSTGLACTIKAWQVQFWCLSIRLPDLLQCLSQPGTGFASPHHLQGSFPDCAFLLSFTVLIV